MMTIEDIKALIEADESRTLELKNCSGDTAISLLSNCSEFPNSCILR